MGNQPSGDVERRVDRRLLLDWAGSHPELGHRIFYDEALQDMYNNMQPSPEQEAMQQPFIHEELACEILISVLAALVTDVLPKPILRQWQSELVRTLLFFP